MALKGFVRKYKPLEIITKEEVESIHKSTLEVLWTTGVRMEHDRALKLLESNGCKVDYENKKVTVYGVVVKFNPAIMERNWVHLQDGTGEKGQHDLTITTNAMVNPGDTMVFTGKITLDKDFGAGYTYELIMEEAEIDGRED